MTKILEALDKHGDTLKKIGSCLTKLEETKLKKAVHVKVLDDEEETKLIMKGTSNLKNLQ